MGGHRKFNEVCLEPAHPSLPHPLSSFASMSIIFIFGLIGGRMRWESFSENDVKGGVRERIVGAILCRCCRMASWG